MPKHPTVRGFPAELQVSAGSGRSQACPEVLILAGRDNTHPDAGGSELFVGRVADGLARAGARVTLFCAAYPGAAAETVDGGVRIVRRGGRLGVFAHAFWAYARGRLGDPAVVVDVQNGLPFLACWYSRAPVLVLVHHVHREAWAMVFGKLVGAVGWWVESRLAPRAYRASRYVAVSEQTRGELASLGVDPGRISVVHNGADIVPAPRIGRTPYPSVCVLGRLVPNKRVEYALEAVAALRPRLPGLRLTVVGKGPDEARLRRVAERLGIADVVGFLGYVDDATKHEVLARSWALAMPSLKEGWGLAVMEAAAHGTPAVGFRDAGGLAECVVDGRTGLLAGDLGEFTRLLGDLLADDRLRTALGGAARERAGRFTWDRSTEAFAGALRAAMTGLELPVPAPDAQPEPVARARAG